MSKNKKIILIVLICIVFLGVFFLNSQIKLPSPNPNPIGNSYGVTILDINGIKYESEVSGKISVYDFMSKLQNEGKITFKDKTYTGMGKLIEEINGLKSNGNKYWIYSVNGVEAQVGVLDYKINPGDIVSWKYGSGTY